MTAAWNISKRKNMKSRSEYFARFYNYSLNFQKHSTTWERRWTRPAKTTKRSAISTRL
jgi:hypothetical protein